MVLRTDVGRVYGEHPGEQKETEIALSCGMEVGILRWAWVPACELHPGVAAVRPLLSYQQGMEKRFVMFCSPLSSTIFSSEYLIIYSGVRFPLSFFDDGPG